VKIAAEQATLSLVNDPATRLHLTTGYDQERVGEVEALLTRDQPRPVELSFAGFLTRQGGEWSVGKIPLVIPAELPNLAELVPGEYVDVHGTPAPGGRVLVESIAGRVEKVSGPLQQIDSNTWMVDRLSLRVTGETHITGNPQLGDEVQAQVTRREDGSLEADTVVVGSSSTAKTPTATRAVVTGDSETPEQDAGNRSREGVSAGQPTAASGLQATPEPEINSGDGESRSQPTQPNQSDRGGESQPNFQPSQHSGDD